MAEKERVEPLISVEDISADLTDLEKYIEDLTNFLPIPLITLNPALKIIDINNSFLFTTGYARHQILSETIEKIFRNPHDIHNVIKKTHDVGVVHNYETVVSTKEKKDIPVLISIVLRKDNTSSIIGYFIAFIDISELKQIECSLYEKINDLQRSEFATLNIMEDLQNSINALTKAEIEISDKNKELQKLNNELLRTQDKLSLLNKNLEVIIKERTADIEKLLKQKDEFINQLGHDLKTPLTPLNILIPIITEREQDPKLKESLDVVSKNIQYMKNLVIKTLTYARLNSDNFKLEFEEINLSQHVNTILTMDAALFQGKNVRIQNNIPPDITVQVDLLQINELFNNLLSNAVKYSQEEELTINFDAQKDDDIVLISVKDNGIGLELEKQQHVFDEFYKIDSSRHDLHSTGLGLSICKRIVEKHGGRIWVESLGLGRGSTFFFTLKQSKNIVPKTL